MSCCPKAWWKRCQEKVPRCLRIPPPEMSMGRSTVLSLWSSYLTQPIRRKHNVQIVRLMVLGGGIGISGKNMASYTQSSWWYPLSLSLLMLHIFLHVSLNLSNMIYLESKHLYLPVLFTVGAFLFTGWIPLSATANLLEKHVITYSQLACLVKKRRFVMRS